ncbi:MAG: ABC transporter permease [Ilumatobacteraceae bacterium]
MAWDLPTAMDVLETDGMIDGVDIVLADGASAEEVTTRLQSVIAPTMEVVTGEQLAEETKDAVGTIIGYIQSGLLAFALITLFVATFIINNTFAITIGQRMRELALLRAIGASGKQVKRLIVREAMILAAIASVIGIAAGFGVSRLLIWIFNRAGAGFPGTESIIKPRTVIIALAVGLGVTFASVIVPSRKAAKIPPVAASVPGARIHGVDLWATHAARRRRDGAGRSHVPDRAVRPPGRHGGADRLRRDRRPGAVPRRGQPRPPSLDR